MHTVFWLENLRVGDHSEDQVVDGKIISEWILGRYGEREWTGFIWLRIRTNGGLM
jgi:hypothetical protein